MTDEYDIPENQKPDLEEDGRDSATQFDVEAAYRAAETFWENGYEEKAIEMLSVGETSVAFWQDKVYEVTGKGIYFNEADSRWHDDITNQYVKDPYFPIRADQYELDQSLINKYS